MRRHVIVACVLATVVLASSADEESHRFFQDAAPEYSNIYTLRGRPASSAEAAEAEALVQELLPAGGKPTSKKPPHISPGAAALADEKARAARELGELQSSKGVHPRGMPLAREGAVASERAVTDDEVKEADRAKAKKAKEVKEEQVLKHAATGIAMKAGSDAAKVTAHAAALGVAVAHAEALQAEKKEAVAHKLATAAHLQAKESRVAAVAALRAEAAAASAAAARSRAQAHKLHTKLANFKGTGAAVKSKITHDKNVAKIVSDKVSNAVKKLVAPSKAKADAAVALEKQSKEKMQQAQQEEANANASKNKALALLKKQKAAIAKAQETAKALAKATAAAPAAAPAATPDEFLVQLDHLRNKADHVVSGADGARFMALLGELKLKATEAIEDSEETIFAQQEAEGPGAAFMHKFSALDYKADAATPSADILFEEEPRREQDGDAFMGAFAKLDEKAQDVVAPTVSQRTKPATREGYLDIIPQETVLPPVSQLEQEPALTLQAQEALEPDVTMTKKPSKQVFLQSKDHILPHVTQLERPLTQVFLAPQEAIAAPVTQLEKPTPVQFDDTHWMKEATTAVPRRDTERTQAALLAVPPFHSPEAPVKEEKPEELFEEADTFSQALFKLDHDASKRHESFVDDTSSLPETDVASIQSTLLEASPFSQALAKLDAEVPKVTPANKRAATMQMPSVPVAAAKAGSRAGEVLAMPAITTDMKRSSPFTQALDKLDNSVTTSDETTSRLLSSESPFSKTLRSLERKEDAVQSAKKEKVEMPPAPVAGVVPNVMVESKGLPEMTTVQAETITPVVIGGLVFLVASATCLAPLFSGKQHK